MQSITTRRFLQIAGMAAASLLLAACGKKQEAAVPAAAPAVASAPAASAPGRVVVVGTDAAYAPFESQNDKGEIVGFDIDVVREVGKRAGFEVRVVNTPWEGIFNELAQGGRDLVISAVTITDERKQTIDFSTPYFDSRQLIAVKNDSKIAKFADLKKIKVGVQTGTTGDEALSKLLGKTDPNIRRFESTPLALKELEAGGVDAVVADNGVIIHYVANNPGGKFKTVTDPEFAAEQYGIAVKKGNAELLAKVNQGLAAFKADGGYDALYRKYFGSAPPSSSQSAASTPAAAASK